MPDIPPNYHQLHADIRYTRTDWFKLNNSVRKRVAKLILRCTGITTWDVASLNMIAFTIRDDATVLEMVTRDDKGKLILNDDKEPVTETSTYPYGLGWVRSNT